MKLDSKNFPHAGMKDLEFVNYLDIPDWDNYESIYIPMFEGEILVR